MSVKVRKVEDMITVNAIGDNCPIPVIKTKKAIQALEGPEVIEVLVDNEIADDELEETVDINTGRNNYIYAINSMLISAVVIMSSVKKRKR